MQYREECFCGNTYGQYGEANEDDCYLKCAGNSTQICGGDWRNSVHFANSGKNLVAFLIL